MNKNLKIVFGIILVIILLWIIIFFVDYKRCSSMNLPIFAIKGEVNENNITYYGLGYKVEVDKYEGQITKIEMYMFNKFIVGAATNINNITSNGEDYVRIIKVNGKLYYDTGKESTLTARCGTMDGEITSNVDFNQIPTENNQSNFDGNYSYQYGTEKTIEVKIDDKWIVFETKTDIITALTLEDEIQDNTIWCGTFQLIWNDLKNDLAKQDIVFTPQIKVAENLNKETFTIDDISDKYYYKKIGTPSIELKEEIEKAIKDKFNETSNILDDFEWKNRDPEDYFLYVMLKKEFEFEKEFEELENGKFGNYENVEYFGIKSDESGELKNQVEVLFYNSKDNFAIKLKTKQEDEVIFCKNPEGKTFNEIYQNIVNQKNNYEGETVLKKGEQLKIPKIKIKEKTEFTELENHSFLFSNGNSYIIEKALQTIDFELDKTGGKIISEAGMMVMKEAIEINTSEQREFFIDDTFAIFLIEDGKDTPYFAGLISDITKFQ